MRKHKPDEVTISINGEQIKGLKNSSYATCSFWQEKLVPSGSVYIQVCKWYQEGQCTCKEAQKEAVSEN